ncbi:transcriptional regulator, AraC family with amidase-like domain [Rhizorhabdus wittichii RW1]|uniref:Transcriptional regulator, AraC family with amidase-like domain n=1 Tax=Rhizorhabdus wittichii (strain DSM 6014 / CCUG 31198 / JCM 15750 / NBRC 105917 / EY 4224 / RW1) TaxID=392499 RepID=A0A9J9H8E6_RHIWR|nr:transcriptional regulator, AraC family with amidase-like domain [Rhizorhabdus wittichii RW1]
MPDFALVALDGAYHASVGALTDSFILARDRIEQVFADSGPMRMETRLRILSLDGGPIRMSDGRRLDVDGAISSVDDHGFVWLPAFRVMGIPALEERLARSHALLPWLRQQAAGGAVIGASGASALILMAAGLTHDVAVPIARALQPVARAMFPRHRAEERLALADHGDLLIANGMAHDLALIVRVMERTLSPDVGRWLTSIMGLDREEEHLLASDPLVARAQIWLEQRFTGAIGIQELAEALSTSQPTLVRRFRKALGMSPKSYIQHLRLQAATRMLEKSNRSIDRIAELVGFSDSRLFRAMFRQRTGMTATQWREASQARRG